MPFSCTTSSQRSGLRPKRECCQASWSATLWPHELVELEMTVLRYPRKENPARRPGLRWKLVDASILVHTSRRCNSLEANVTDSDNFPLSVTRSAKITHPQGLPDPNRGLTVPTDKTLSIVVTKTQARSYVTSMGEVQAPTEAICKPNAPPPVRPETLANRNSSKGADQGMSEAAHTAPVLTPDGRRGRTRTKDLETSRKRIAMYEQFKTELSTVQQWRKKNRRSRSFDFARLKCAHPDLLLWKNITESEQRDLLTDELNPSTYAWNIVRRVFGLSGEISSREVLKKDRAKLRDAERGK
jgi:hypothetical protein